MASPPRSPAHSTHREGTAQRSAERGVMGTAQRSESGVVQCLAVCDDAYLLHEPNTLCKQLNTLIAAQRDVTRRRMTRHHKE